ncbi:site-specific integrase [Dysgonomonas sp. 25]|uniref:site-specific integrase n=1 Tax=Dysgonomonas sp. 25 TaxID=2302933 RepID=UPI0013D5930C|nr:site-specific integrase [Dysgonomonas sp. 25]NDV70371.1 site-specific integrase [Dysgonomonas sp. 25]
MRTSKSTFNITFYLRKDKMKKNSFTPIFCRVTIAGEAVSFNIHKDIRAEIWDMENHKAMGSSREAREVNQILDACRTILHNKYRDIFEKDNFVTAEKLKNSYLGISTDNTMLLELFRDLIKDIEALVGINKTKATLQKYKVTYTRLSEFMKFKYNISDINVKEIKYQFISDFEVYLRTQANCSPNTTAKFIQFFKRVILIAQNNGWMQHNPFANYKIHFKKVDRGYLTDQELDIIKNKEFDIERLEKVRDIFVFACYTGLAYVDTFKLTYDNIKIGIDDKLWIMTRRAKTDTIVNVPLLNIPLAIIEKYRGQQKDDKVLPTLSNQKMNSYLKEIADLCGIEKRLSFHLARHTFASTTTLAKGVSIEAVSKMLGHTNIKTTQIYARITENMISNEMSKLTL